MEPKRHHYVSQFYLAAWTNDGSKTGKLVVTDIKTGSQRPGSPKGEANAKDLYTIEDRANPLIVEHAFSKLENEVAPLIRRIEADQELPPASDDMAVLLEWIALQHQRVLRMRGIHEDHYDRLGRTMVQVATQDDKTFEQIRRGVRAQGGSLENASREELRQALPNLKFKMNQTTLIEQMLDGTGAVARTLMGRNWLLLVAPPGVPDFITSDNPVSLVPTSSRLARMPLGFALPETSVLYPLTPRLAVSGQFEEQPRKKILDLARVAKFNSLALQTAERSVYSRRKRIYHSYEDGIRATFSGFSGSEAP